MPRGSGINRLSKLLWDGSVWVISSISVNYTCKILHGWMSEHLCKCNTDNSTRQACLQFNTLYGSPLCVKEREIARHTLSSRFSEYASFSTVFLITHKSICFEQKIQDPRIQLGKLIAQLIYSHVVAQSLQHAIKDCFDPRDKIFRNPSIVVFDSYSILSCDCSLLEHKQELSAPMRGKG